MARSSRPSSPGGLAKAPRDVVMERGLRSRSHHLFPSGGPTVRRKDVTCRPMLVVPARDVGNVWPSAWERAFQFAGDDRCSKPTQPLDRRSELPPWVAVRVGPDRQVATVIH